MTHRLSRRAYLSGLGAVALFEASGCANGVARATTEPRIGEGRRGPLERPAGQARRADPRPLEPTEPRALAPAPAETQAPELDLPVRPKGAETGRQFLARLEGLGRGAIDDQVVAAIEMGNVPAYLRKLVPLEVMRNGALKARLFVTNDYLSIGSDDDFIRMPMTSAAAQKIANRLDASLPTPKLVDLVYEQAAVRLPPSYIDGGPTDDSLSDFIVHHAKLESRRIAGNFPLGVLTAGHKKDIVLSVRLAERDDRVAIYGWHKKDGGVIQSLSCKHSCRYADYSHGVRLVAEAMMLDGKPRRVSDVLADPDDADVLSDEGPLPIVGYATVLPDYAPSTEHTKDASKRKKPKPRAN